MKITELKTIQFKSVSHGTPSPWGYWIYPREMLAAEPRESSPSAASIPASAP